MKRTKRFISLLLILIMALGLFTGCKKGEESANKGDRKLVIGIPQNAAIPNYDTNAFTLLVEQETGIDLSFFFFASSVDHYKQQLTLMCTSGDTLPDVLLLGGMGHYIVNQFGEDGFLQDLSPYLKDAKNYQKTLKSLDKEMRLYTEEKMVNTTNDAVYAMPSVASNDELFMDAKQSNLYINKAWLDKLELEVPTNIKELENVARQFATKDPNGNGEKDEIAILGSMAVTNWIINAFVEYQAANFNVKDGKVWDPIYSDEFRRGVQYVAKLASEGLYDKLGLTITNTEIKNLVSPIRGVGKVGILAGHHETFTNVSTNAIKDYVAMPMLADETGKGGYSIWNEPELQLAAMVSKDCKNVELAMELLDFGYTDIATTSIRYGEKGVDWEEADGTNAYGTHSNFYVLNTEATFDMNTNKTWGQNCSLPCHVTWENYMPVVKTEDSSGYVGNVARLHGEQVAVGRETGKQREGTLNQLVYTEKEYEKREEKAGLVSSEITSKIQLFVAGEKNINDDKVWNEFLDTLKTLGRDELKKIAQDAYDRKVERNKNAK